MPETYSYLTRWFFKWIEITQRQQQNVLFVLTHITHNILISFPDTKSSSNMLFVQWRTLKECINNKLNQLSRLIIWFFGFFKPSIFEYACWNRSNQFCDMYRKKLWYIIEKKPSLYRQEWLLISLYVSKGHVTNLGSSVAMPVCRRQRKWWFWFNQSLWSACPEWGICKWFSANTIRT